MNPELPLEVFEFDGRLFWTLDEFFDRAGSVLIPGIDWGHNLDAFNDILRMGPEEGYILRWKHSALSRERLGEKTFGILCEIIRVHGKGGSESSDGVELILE